MMDPGAEPSLRPLALVGPTASGKTALSIPLAEGLGGEIISMDSRQVYRGMDVGTAKVSPELRRRVPHHGLDLVNPDERFSAGRFARAARRWVGDVQSRGGLPLLVGGTGFFLKALVEPVFREPSLDPDQRDRLREWLATQSLERLAAWVHRLDPERAALAEAGGRQRLSRTLELPLLTGRSLSWWHAHAPPEARALEVDVVLLTLPREILYHRINVRAEAMFQSGLLEETQALLDGGYAESDPGMTGTGYREAADVLLGKTTLPEALDRVQRVTRAYARRQLTWFRHQLPENVLEVDALLPLEEQLGQVLHWIGQGRPRVEGRSPATEAPPERDPAE